MEDGLGAAYRLRNYVRTGYDGGARDSAKVSAGLPVLVKAVLVKELRIKVVTRSTCALVLKSKGGSFIFLWFHPCSV